MIAQEDFSNREHLLNLEPPQIIATSGCRQVEYLRTNITLRERQFTRQLTANR
jgi:hypothetical protein